MYRPDAPGWVAGQKALKLMGKLCTEKGIPFVVVIFPLFGQPLDAGYPFAEIHATGAQAASAAGAKVVDLLPAYEGLRWDLLVVDGAADEHPNEIAHRIAADVLLKALDDVVLPVGPAAAPTGRGEAPPEQVSFRASNGQRASLPPWPSPSCRLPREPAEARHPVAAMSVRPSSVASAQRSSWPAGSGGRACPG